jgi:hypothetical protein
MPSSPATNAKAFAQGSECDEAIQNPCPAKRWIASLALAMTNSPVIACDKREGVCARERKRRTLPVIARSERDEAIQNPWVVKRWIA